MAFNNPFPPGGLDGPQKPGINDLAAAFQVIRQRRLGPGRGKPSLMDQYLRQQALARKRPNSGAVRGPAPNYGVAQKPTPSVTGGTPYAYPRF